MSRDSEDADEMIALRWRGIRARIRDAGAPDGLCRAFDDVVGERRGAAGAAGQFLIGADDEVLLDEQLDQPPAHEVADWSPLPNAAPLLTMIGPQSPHILVQVDRVDADITVIERAVAARERVRGGDWPVTKVRSGGMSQRRIHNRAENLWEKNGKQVAERIDELAAETDPSFIGIFGDIRAKGALRGHLAEQTLTKVVDLDDFPGGDVRLAEAEVVAARAADEDAAVIERLRKNLGRGQEAVHGLGDVVAAARRGQIETVVLENDPSSTTRLFAGPDPLALGLRADDLTATAGAQVVADRADAVLIRALAAADASIVMARPGGVGLRDGIGAVLRYSDGSNADWR